MKELEIKIESILNGIAPSYGFFNDGQVNASIGIDPDFPATDSQVQPSGLLRPTAMTKFSGSTMDQTPLWILTNPKSTNIYVYANAGDFYSYSSSLGSETLVSAISSSGGNGAVYYDNYIYLMKNTQIMRYGPLNGSPAISNDLIANSELLDGWASGSDTLLTDTTYPSIRGIEMPNHVAHRHTDDSIYICDVHAGGYGILNRIKTTKTTVEGDTNSGSGYNVLDFDAGLYPTTLASYQTSLAVALIEGVSTSVRQKHAKISFWDTTSESFAFITDDEFPDPLITAMLNVNGVLYVASGSASGGCRISQYVGGYTHSEIYYNPDMFPPLQGAFAHLLSRVVFGSATTYPEATASVFGIGSMANIGNGVHGILKATSAGATPYVTALAYVQNDAFAKLSPIVGWHDDSGVGIDKLSTTYGVSVVRFGPYRIGEKFEIYEIQIPCSQAIAANMTVTPKIYVDNLTANTTLRLINATNFANSDKMIKIFTHVIGKQDFVLELRWSGTALLTLGLPIIKLRTLDG